MGRTGFGPATFCTSSRCPNQARRPAHLDVCSDKLSVFGIFMVFAQSPLPKPFSCLVQDAKYVVNRSSLLKYQKRLRVQWEERGGGWYTKNQNGSEFGYDLSRNNGLADNNRRNRFLWSNREQPVYGGLNQHKPHHFHCC